MNIEDPVEADADVDDEEVIDPTFPKDGFCAEGGWALCEDFDGRGQNGPTMLDLTGTSLSYNLHDHGRITGVTCEVSQDCEPYFEGGAMFTNAEDSGFGWSAIRLQHPFDFEGREGHLRFTTNLIAHGRMNLGIILSPLVTNAMPDNRRFTNNAGTTIGALNAAPALAVRAFRTLDQGGRAVADVQVWNNGLETQFIPVDTPHVIGFDPTILHEVDFYISRTRVRMLVDGATILDKPLDNLGFDRAYIYLSGLSYNAMKEPDVPHTREQNIFMWDNIAFDGPALPKNAITPLAYQDVVFRANAVSSCLVKGVPAQGPLEDFYQKFWAGWTVRLPADVGPVTAADITCTLHDWPRDSSQPQWGQIETITR